MSSEPYDAQTAPVKGRPLRSDARRTRERLLRAAGDLLAAGAPFTLSDVAAAAGVSTATAYRHFPSADHAADGFTSGFVDDVGERLLAAQLAGDPAVRLLEVCEIWVRTVLDWGPALAHLRSPEGFLRRRARGEPTVTRSLRVVEPSLAAVLPPGAGAEELDYVIGVWNQLADPREVLEQRDVLGWAPDRIAARLQAAVLAVAGTLGG